MQGKNDYKYMDGFIDLLAQGMAEVVRHGRLRWFGHMEHKSRDDWVSIYWLRVWLRW